MAATPNLVQGIWKTISDTAKQSINNKLHLRPTYAKLGIRNLEPYLINSSFIIMLLRAYRHKVSILPQRYCYRVRYSDGLTLFSPIMNHAIARAEAHYDQDIARYLPNDAKHLVIIDAGAHIGSFFLPIAAKYANSVAVAIELDPNNALAINKALAKNQMQNCICVQKALWSEGNHKVQVDVRSSTTNNVIEAGFFGSLKRGGIRTYSADTVTLREVFQTARKLSQQAGSESNATWILKMDIEGSEYEVLKGNLDLINSVDILVIELHATHTEIPRASWLYQHIQQNFDVIMDRDSSDSFKDSLVELIAVRRMK
jgi:FkbM family methyltransferase